MENTVTMISSRGKRLQMKNTATMALMLGLGVAGICAQPIAYAQQRTVRMTFSGTGGPSVINLNYPNTSTGEENVAGRGTLGSFTFRNVNAAETSPQPSDTCTGIFFKRVAGAGVLRFQDGSLMKVTLTEGGDCIDVVHMVGHCVLTLQIAGGTGRFKDASGVLTYDETALPVLADAANNLVYFTEAGEITGTISRLTREDFQDISPEEQTAR
jgi:hypothetical protein